MRFLGWHNYKIWIVILLYHIWRVLLKWIYAYVRHMYDLKGIKLGDTKEFADIKYVLIGGISFQKRI